MVKGFDTTISDPSKQFLDYLLTFLDSNKETITPQKAESYLRQWLISSKSTSDIYRKFKDMQKKPRIILRKHCLQPLLKIVPYEGDPNFGGFQQQNQINICLSSIRNKIELKQNVDRELYFMYNKNMTKQNASSSQQRDQRLIQNLYVSCQQGYKNYGWQSETTKRLAKKCAVYLFRRRSSSNLPPDSLFRYASRIADEFCL